MLAGEYEGEGEADANQEAEEREVTDLGIHTVDMTVDVGICLQQTVDETIDERHVQRDEQDCRFCRQHAKRAGEVLS